MRLWVLGLASVCAGLVVSYQAISTMRRELTGGNALSQMSSGLRFLPKNLLGLLRAYRSAYPQGKSANRLIIGVVVAFLGSIDIMIGMRTGL